ncbi:MAG: aa3-type cytochrome c oxidase subunit IV [Pseudomonadota bacterium]
MADEHEHGKMDVTHHEKTFAGFVTVVKWTVIAIIGILIFLALFRA